MLGRVLQWLKLPGLIQPFEYYDVESGQVIKLRTSRYYTTLTIGSKELLFVRENGRMDGVGLFVADDAEARDRLLAEGTHGVAGSPAASGPPQ